MPVCGAGCTLPDGFVSIQNLIVVGISGVTCKASRDGGCTCKVLDMSNFDLYEIALSNVDT